jgi:CDP-4-dehydro-6-deoxyglucose reductase
VISLQARLLRTWDLAPEVRHFVFEVPDREEFPFQAGQFVSLSETLNGKKITRAYSLASEPAGNQFELCLNRLEDGIFSPYMFTLAPGATIDMQPPLGYFVLRPNPIDAIFIATGTGIAPFRGMLRAQFPAAAPPADTRNITLLFGIRYENGILYRNEFEEFEHERPSQFRFWPTLSRGSEHWHGRRGHVQQHLDEAIGERRDLEIYICGLKAMVDDVRARLKQMGFDRKQIIYEKYD